MDVDVPLESMVVDVTDIYGYPSSAFTACPPPALETVTFGSNIHQHRPGGKHAGYQSNDSRETRSSLQMQHAKKATSVQPLQS
jgi:hypothetical protein